MAKVKVVGFTIIREIFGASCVEIDVTGPQTVKGVLDALIGKYGQPLREMLCDPQTGEYTPFPLRLNDEIISSALDSERPIESGDEITIIFPVGGGC